MLDAAQYREAMQFRINTEEPVSDEEPEHRDAEFDVDEVEEDTRRLKIW